MATEFEWTVWDDAANAPATEIQRQAVEACTACRARFAATNLERYRSLKFPIPTTPFMFMLGLARARVFSPRSFIGMTANVFILDLANEYARRGWHPQMVASSWTEDAGRVLKGKHPVKSFMFRTSQGSTLLALATNLSISGPLTLGVVGPMVIPRANTRDAVCVSRKSAYVDPRLASEKYMLRWRQPGATVRDLGVGSYLDLLLPLT